ncbi:putative ankyrin [Helianthus anomalus]
MFLSLYHSYFILLCGDGKEEKEKQTETPSIYIIFVCYVVSVTRPPDFAVGIKEEDLELVNENSNTALYLAAAAGNIKTVRIMVEKNRGLLTIPGARRQIMPLYSAALFIMIYLYVDSLPLLKLKVIVEPFLDVALQIVKKHPKLETGNLLGILARKPDVFSETNYNVNERSISSGKHLYLLENKILSHRGSGKKDQVRYLQKLVSKHIAKMRVASTLKETHSSRVLFIAAEMGNTKFLVELIRRYPDLMW